ncbi:MAG: hypothetical protein IT452_09070 [Planctomycetia bacterium]|nr:hypothetical protein [Planctomycetia bacterium]
MNANNVISIKNGGTALSAFQRVKLGVESSAVVAQPADAADASIGSVLQDTAAGGIADILRTSAGSHYAIAAGEIAAGAEVEAADGGRVATKAQGAAKGVALQAASGAGAIIRVVYF